MAASLLRLGFCRRLKITINSKEKTQSIQDVIALINSGFLSQNHVLKKQITALQHLCDFHSSSCAIYANVKIDTRRRDFLLARLDKKKQERMEVWRNISISELAAIAKRNPDDILEILHNHISEGHFYKSKKDLINNTKILIDIVKFFGKTPIIVPSKLEDKDDAHLDAVPRSPDPERLVKRPPIVTIMGHVDHGKTTLLDYLRNANVVASEFGGITQHIGAFSVKLGDNDSVTFIDTPGHAAFASMRSRGAHATDIVVLVVAADDGVMEQTLESIRMAKEAGAPIIVAINKIDKPNANVKRTEEMLAQHQLFTESMGGDTQAVPISALNGTNVDTLVEAILLQSEIMNLQADPSGLAEGIIIESRQDPHKGKLASAIIQQGTLRKGAYLVAGSAYGKVRLMFDELGRQIAQAPPSTPVEMMGWKDLPAAGEILLEVESEKRAQKVLRHRKSKEDTQKALAAQEVIEKKIEDHKKVYMEKRRKAYELGYQRLKEKKPKEWEEDLTPKVKVIIKGDVDGSVEAILDVLETYSSAEVPLDIVHFGVGETSPNDLEIAKVFNAIIYCFNVKTSPKLKEDAKKKGIIIRHMNVIYRLIDDVKKELTLKMPSVEKETVLGKADVIQQFDVNEKRKKLIVAGLRVTKGEIVKAEKVKLLRDGEVLYNGSIASLRHLKDEVNSIKNGSECGLMLGDATIPVKLGDTIVCYKTDLVQEELDWDPGF